MKRLLSLLLVLALILCSFAACGKKEETPQPQGGEEKTDSKYGGILYIDDTGNKAELGYPGKITQSSVIRHNAPGIETLLKFVNGKLECFLLDSYNVDLTAMTLTLKLKDGIKFHDGTPLDAEAMKWNFQQHIDNGQNYFNCFDSMEVKDALTLVCKLNSWDNSLTTMLASYAGMMISKDACEKNGVDWARSNPVGTGPFKFVEWQKDVKIVWEKNENYWQEGLPYLDGIVMTFTADDTSRELALRNGDINVMLQGNTSATASLVKDGYALNSIPAGSIPYTIYPSSANPNSPLSNLKVRQAVAYAINNELLVESVMDGYGFPANQFAYTGSWGNTKDVKGYPYNVETSKKLLAEAGYADGFSCDYQYNESSDNADLIAEAVQAMLAEVGIKVTLKPISDGAHKDMMQNGVEWDGFLQGGASAQPDTAQQMKLNFSGGKYYVSTATNPDTVALLSEATSAPTQEAKEAKVHEAMVKLIDEECFAFPLFHSLDMSVMSTKVHDVGVSLSMPATVWTPELCYIDK